MFYVLRSPRGFMCAMVTKYYQFSPSSKQNISDISVTILTSKRQWGVTSGSCCIHICPWNKQKQLSITYQMKNNLNHRVDTSETNRNSHCICLLRNFSCFQASKLYKILMRRRDHYTSMLQMHPPKACLTEWTKQQKVS